MTNIHKAITLYDIQDAVSIDTPVDSNSKFYENLTPYRSDFTDKKIFRQLNINPKTSECNPLKSSKKIFLSGYRGTGKTSELLTLKNKIDETKCYLTIFVDISEEELDTANIETVDILILMLEKLIEALEKKGADISDDVISDFYDWYKTKIVKEVNESLKGSAQIELKAESKVSLLSFSSLVANTKAKLQGSIESKKVIRQEINNNFKMFSMKFNEFIHSLVQQLREKEHYKDLLFIIDGFEKIGSLNDRKKILVDDSNKLTIIESHMLIALPIELFTEKNRLSHFSFTENFPLIDLSIDGAKECFKNFILKRVDEKLFAKDAIEMIVEFGAGHPRQTLQIINRAYFEADEILDTDSIKKAIQILGNELSKVSPDELKILKDINNNVLLAEDDCYTKLKAKNIVFEYGDDKVTINPVVLENKKFKILLNQDA
ncbi:MAG: hypothetical protein U9N02_07190 [Campylobacterota bacterium]|nr:hypothetical protein [Campylobacterota bacterium]